MVEHILDQIMSPNPELKTEVNICRSLHSSSFFKSSTYLSTVVARLYPSENPSSGHFRKRSIYATFRGSHCRGIGRYFNGRGHGIRSGGIGIRGRLLHGIVSHGGDRGTYENGNDVSDVTRYFEHLEWAAFSKNTRKSITEYTVRTNFLVNKNSCITSSISAE